MQHAITAFLVCGCSLLVACDPPRHREKIIEAVNSADIVIRCAVELDGESHKYRVIETWKGTARPGEVTAGYLNHTRGQSFKGTAPTEILYYSNATNQRLGGHLPGGFFYFYDREAFFPNRNLHPGTLDSIRQELEIEPNQRLQLYGGVPGDRKTSDSD